MRLFFHGPKGNGQEQAAAAFARYSGVSLLAANLAHAPATEVELREGQHLSIAGLLDNESTRNLTKIPILGDIPILGELFKSRALRQRRTELVVIVTPRLVMASDSAPPIPTGEPGTTPPPGTWRWERHLKGNEKPSSPLQPGGSSQPQQ